MKGIGIIGLSVLIAASLSTTVMAGDKGAPKGEKQDMFKKADANGDGKLSLEEFKTICTKGDAEAKFTAADTDKDGFLTKEEFKAAHKGHGGKHAKKDVVPAPEAPAAAAPAPVAPAK